MIDLLNKNLEQILSPGDGLVVAVSGGVDSVVLLEKLVDFKSGFEVRMVVVHLNHQTRGEESDRDEKFVKEMAEGFGLDFVSEVVDVSKMEGSVETNGRKVRYEFFERVRKEKGYQWIVTAHHANDSLETVLMNFSRGCGVRGMCGIGLVNGVYLRPLYNVRKQEILDFASTEGLKWFDDYTNEDLEYKRNLIRKTVVPALKEINPHLESTFLESQQYWMGLEQELGRDFGELFNQGDKCFGLEEYLGLSSFAKGNFVSYVYEFAYGSTQGLSKAHVAEVLKVLEGRRNGAKTELGAKFWLVIDAGVVRLVGV